MITLHQFAPAFGLPNPSPFCMKVETALKLAAIDYRVETVANPAAGPKGKCPFITDGSLRLGDSEFILDHLERRHGADFDAGLTPEQRRLSYLVRVLLEEHLYWVGLYERWLVDANWERVRAAFFGEMPPVVRNLLPLVARLQVRRNLRGQGMGRHSREEITAFGRQAIDHVAALAGEGDYFHGAECTRIDTTLHAFLANLLAAEFDTPLREAVLAHPSLVAYCDRMNQRFYPNPG